MKTQTRRLLVSTIFRYYKYQVEWELHQYYKFSLYQGCIISVISVLPKDQISTSGPYGKREITSGDIQYGVPTNDFLLGNSCDTCAQKPKSDSFTCNKSKLPTLKQHFWKYADCMREKMAFSNTRNWTNNLTVLCYMVPVTVQNLPSVHSTQTHALFYHKLRDQVKCDF